MDKQLFLQTKLTDDQVALFYLGQEGFLIKYHDKYLLIDPYLSDYVDRNCCTNTVKWVRRYPAPIAAEELDFIDYVLCTHEHFDHADPETLRTLAKVNPNAKFIAPKPIRDTILSYGINPNLLIDAVADATLHDDEFDIDFPDTLILEKYTNVLDWYKDPENRCYKKPIKGRKNSYDR